MVTRIGAALVLVAAGAWLSRLRRLGLERSLLIAAVRAIVQLTAVALVVDTVFAHLSLATGFVLVMVGAAAWTAGGRWYVVPGARLRAAAAIATATGGVLAVVFGTGAFQRTPRFLIPVAGIVAGGAMVAAGIAGRRVSEEISDHLSVIEARLSLGASASEALAPHRRRAITTALIPALDQTRNVGLVTLPGAFVGMLLGGSTPLQAAEVQLVVLLSLLGGEVIAATVATELVAATHVMPGDRVIVRPVRSKPSARWPLQRRRAASPDRDGGLSGHEGPTEDLQC
ncbi:MAG: ABC transporter permease [Acidimicrobiia bacterium]